MSSHASDDGSDSGPHQHRRQRSGQSQPARFQHQWLDSSPRGSSSPAPSHQSSVQSRSSTPNSQHTTPASRLPGDRSRPPLTPLRVPPTSAPGGKQKSPSARTPTTPQPGHVLRRVSDKIFGKKPQEQGNVCRSHGSATCATCIFFCRLDRDGNADMTKFFDSEKSMAVEPLRGDAAMFDYRTDEQVVRMDLGGSVRGSVVGMEAAAGALGPIPPSTSWFVHCKACGLLFLSGHIGRTKAAVCPSHLSTPNNHRTVAVWVDAEIHWDRRGKPEGEYSIFFAPGSHFNTNEVYWNFFYPPSAKLEIQFLALTRTISLAAERIKQQRDVLIAKHGLSNSAQFLQKAKRFRLLVITPLEFVRYAATILEYDEEEQVYLDGRNGKVFGKEERARTLVQFLDTIKELAGEGIEVKFQHCPEGRMGEEYAPEWDVEAASRWAQRNAKR